jgi:hypothetical protein
VFEFFKKKDETLKAYDNPLIEKFHGNLMNPINTGRMDLWKRDLTKKQIMLADQIAGKDADLLGYQRETRRFSPWLRLKALPMRIYGYLVFRLMVYGSYLPYRANLWLSLRMLILVKAYSYLFSKKSH